MWQHLLTYSRYGVQAGCSAFRSGGRFSCACNTPRGWLRKPVILACFTGSVQWRRWAFDQLVNAQLKSWLSCLLLVNEQARPLSWPSSTTPSLRKLSRPKAPRYEPGDSAFCAAHSRIVQQHLRQPFCTSKETALLLCRSDIPDAIFPQWPQWSGCGAHSRPSYWSSPL